MYKEQEIAERIWKITNQVDFAFGESISQFFFIHCGNKDAEPIEKCLKEEMFNEEGYIVIRFDNDDDTVFKVTEE